MNLLELFLSFLKENILLSKNDKTLIAVSGGVDSIVLAHLFHKSRLPFSIVHCNFNLRKEDSFEDEMFVKNLSLKYDVSLYIKQFDTKGYAKNHNISIQMAARNLRYDWFLYTANKNKYQNIATAHHQNDSLETILLNLIKGTGIAGLHGIRPKTNFDKTTLKHINLIRPLIFASKEMVLDYAKSNKLDWREDISNNNNDYQRNLIRNTIIPQLKKINPNLENTFKATTERLSQAENIVNEKIEYIKNEIISIKKDSCQINIESIKNKSWKNFILFEIIKEFGFNFDQTKNIFKSIKNKGKLFYSENYRIIVNYELLHISLKDHIKSKEYILDQVNKAYILDNSHKIYTYKKSSSKYEITANKNIAALDFEKVKFPLIIRKWKKGDKFQPLGMITQKKISDFFIDSKISIQEKEKTYIMLSNNDIIWIIGYRISEKFKITSKTKFVLEISYKDQIK